MKKDKLTKELDNAIDTSDVKVKWLPDPKGYFTIKIFPKRNSVFVRYYDAKSELAFTFSGTNTPQIVQGIIDRGLVSTLTHAAYLGKELEKAVIALKNGMSYIQDKELSIKKKGKKDD